MAVCGVSEAGCACGVGSGGCSQEHCEKVCPDPIAFPRKSFCSLSFVVFFSSLLAMCYVLYVCRVCV